MNALLNAGNLAACILLLLYLLAAASQAKMWRHRLTLIPLTLVIGIQATDPILLWIPELGWPNAALNMALAYTVTIYRRDLWHLIRAKFNPDRPPLERSGDSGMLKTRRR